MFNKIYIYLIFFFIKNVNNIFFDILLNKKIIKNNLLFFYFIKIKKKIEKQIFLLYNNKSTYTSFYQISKNYNQKKYFLNKKIEKNKFFFFESNLKILNLNNINDYFSLYNFFFKINYQLNSKFYSKYYYNLFFGKKKIPILNIIFLKNNFYKFFKIILTASFLNLKPFIYEDFNLNSVILIKYINFLNKKIKYDYIFLINPLIKAKYFKSLKKLKLPLFSIVDNSININCIDYPIFVKKIDYFCLYFFFCIYQHTFFFGQNLKKKYYKNLYLNIIKLNLIKELIIKNEIKKKKWV